MAVIGAIFVKMVLLSANNIACHVWINPRVLVEDVPFPTKHFYHNSCRNFAFVQSNLKSNIITYRVICNITKYFSGIGNM